MQNSRNNPSLLKLYELILSPEEYCQIFDFQQSILKKIAEGEEDHYEILNDLCRLAESMLPNAIASIMLLDPLSNKMHVIAAPSVPPEGIQALSGLHPGPGGGSCGNAVFHNEAQYVLDTKKDERWCDIRQIAYDFNLCSCWSMPIRDEEAKAIGSFALSSFEHRSPSLFHKQLLQIGSAMISILLKRYEREVMLQEKQKKLSIFRKAIEQASDGVVLTDATNGIVYANPTFTRVFGWSFEEIKGKNPNVFASGQHDHAFYQMMWKRLMQEGYWNGEICNKRKNGELFPEWLSITVIRNESGEIENFLAVFTDLSQIKATQEKLKHLAYIDQLTCLPNRQKLLEDLEGHETVACIIFNINSFKEINEYFGAAIGDTVLQLVAKWFQSTGHLVYRLGSDEFVMIIKETLLESSLQKIVATLLEEISLETFSIEHEVFSIHMTAGIAIEEERCLTHATIALHKAKAKKMEMAFYNPKDHIEEKFHGNIAVSGTIRHALASGRMICYYQPVFNFVTNTMDKYEVLVRMIDDHGNVVAPLDFLPIAKQTNLYTQITRCVVTQACQLFEHRTERFGINLSASDILDEMLVEEIIQIITTTQTASRIVFEILETEGIENFEEVARFIERVKALGASIAIDDFGTGYSNFENILKLNVDIIKIDGSLIKNIINDPRSALIVETIVAFAQKIGAQTVAEYVYDESIYHAIQALGINNAQGYFIGKPEPLEM